LSKAKAALEFVVLGCDFGFSFANVVLVHRKTPFTPSGVHTTAAAAAME